MEHPRRFSKKGSRPAAAIADLSTTGAAGRVYAGIDIRRGRFGFFCGHKATKRPPYQTEWPVDLRGPYGPSVYPGEKDPVPDFLFLARRGRILFQQLLYQAVDGIPSSRMAAGLFRGRRSQRAISWYSLMETSSF